MNLSSHLATVRQAVAAEMECVSVRGAGKQASDGRKEKIMSQDREKDITAPDATQHNYSLTVTHTHK